MSAAPPATSVTYPQRFVIKRLPQDDDELWYTVWALWGIRIPRHAVCDGHVAPFDAFAEAYFARVPMAIWKASRGLGGKSRTLAALGLTEGALLGCEVSILGGSTAQSANVHDATKDYWSWHAAPRYLLPQPPTRFDTRMSHGGHLRTLTASQTSVRGPHPPRLRMDEIDEMDINILDSALGQPMEQPNYLGDMVPTNVVMSSTHQYPDKTMSEMIRRSKTQGFPLHEWCYRESSNPVDGWLTKKAIERAKSVVSEIMWQTEYDLQEPSFAGRAINSEAVHNAFDADLGEFTGDNMVVSNRIDGQHYITGVDWAKSRDQTIITTFDTTQRPWVAVAWQKVNQLPWPMLVQTAVDQYRRYGGRLVHDSTGVGAAAHDLLKEKLTASEFANVKAVTMSGGRWRDALYTEYIAAIEHGDIKFPKITYVFNEHLYVTPADLFGRGHPPDSIVSAALAWSERGKRIIVAAPAGAIRGSSPWAV